jgi:putative RNA 2'-phosphotransferase
MDRKQAEQLARFLAYALGRRPDEFGLVTDGRGFIPLADTLKVAHAEGWTHVRRNHLDALNFHLGRPVIECRGHLVRAADRSRLAEMPSASAPPKLLFTPIRRRAYEAVARNGLGPQGHTGRVVLFAEKELARKVGRRRDADPVLVTVNVAAARSQGCVLQSFGQRIFLTDAVPAAACRLPRAPRIRQLREKDPPAPAPPSGPQTPGSFILNPAALPDGSAGRKPRGRGPRSKDWKRQRQQARRWKQNRRRSD